MAPIAAAAFKLVYSHEQRRIKRRSQTPDAVAYSAKRSIVTISPNKTVVGKLEWLRDVATASTTLNIVIYR